MTELSPTPFGPGLMLHRRLGAGGMAEVFRGVQTGIGGFQKVVAIKRMLPNLADTVEFEKMFQNEVNLTGKLQHPNVVQVFGNGQFDGYLYVVMEFVNGRDLARILGTIGGRGESLPMNFAVMIASEVARALDYAHSFRDPETNARECLVHRDISPQNIMVTFDGQVKVVDFGIAKVTDGVEATRTGTIRGKLAYMAPEQAGGEPFDHRIDIFALGVVLHECLTGGRLFRGANQAETLRRVLMCKVEPPSAKNPLVPRDLDAIVMKALAREQAERYASAYELQRDLNIWLSTHAPGLVLRELGAYLAALFADAIAAERDADRLVSSEYLPTSNTPVTPQRPPTRTGTPSLAPKIITTTGSGRIPVVPAARPKPSTRAVPTIVLTVLAIVLSGLVAVKLLDSVEAKVPPKVDGLVGWYRADTLGLAQNERVRSWPSGVDGIPGDALQPDESAQPIFRDGVLNGSPVVQFNGKTHFLMADDLSRALREGIGMTIMFVGRVLEDRPQFVVAVQEEDANTDVVRIGFAAPALIRVKASPVHSTTYIDSQSQALFGFAIYAIVVSQTEVDVLFDGNTVVTEKINPPSFALARRVTIGQEWDNGMKPSDYFAGEIAELVVFDRALGRSDRRSIEAYLAKKFSLRRD